jgi:hypothetical protein
LINPERNTLRWLVGTVRFQPRAAALPGQHDYPLSSTPPI